MNKELLLKVVDHLRNGQLGHQVFDFNHINVNIESLTPGVNIIEYAGGICGTNGCALGELPIIFPEDWSFDSYSNVKYCMGRLNTFDQAEEFFDLTEEEVNYLFSPGSIVEGFSGLPNDATKEQVADHIEKFVNERSQNSTS